MFHYLYILQSLKDGKFYTGVTSDLRKRLKEHNSGKNISTSYRQPLRLIYYEAYLLKKDAEDREKYLKTSMGKRVLKKQLKNFINSAKSGKISLEFVEAT
ncbi:MAG: GIY-YIG nuclease family protein [bacterium]|nr:GIY-YIG nuclease family protein [bacterium]